MSKELDYKQIGFRIKTLRLRNGIMQTELAKRLGLSQTHMSNIEGGKAGLTVENLVKLATEFGCTLDSIIFGDERPALNVDTEPANDKDLLSSCTIGEFLQALQMLKK